MNYAPSNGNQLIIRQSSEGVLHDDILLQSPILPADSTHTDNNDDHPLLNSQSVTSKRDKIARTTIFVLCLTFLVIGRAGVPENDVPCTVDHVQSWLQSINNFILKNPHWRDGLQIICSSFLDLMFITTSINWIMRGTTSRLVISALIFYTVRIFIQSTWVMSTPVGYWWYNPGFPSLTVSYAGEKDFFYSGYAGLVTICANEWRKIGNTKMAALLVLGGVYTCFVLLAFRVNYSIDLFAGITFAHYIFILVDQRKDSIDQFFLKVHKQGKKFMSKIFSRQ